MAVEHMAKTLQKYKNEKLAEFGLRSMHLMFLFQLNQSEEGLTGTELAATCSVDKAFISRVTNELTALGYVEYRNKVGTRYKNRLILTEQGKNVMGKVSEIIDEAVSVVTKEISAEQFDTFYTVLSMVDRRLEESAVTEK
jgi:DNA-binding MarR family transcriptional regulator